MKSQNSGIIRKVMRSGGSQLISLPKLIPGNWRYVEIFVEKVSEDEYIIRLKRVGVERRVNGSNGEGENR
ncbi:MAG: hypothetical protein NDF52_05265 [archaeon YNP-WB-062]|nr:hypothetical protein [Candidatus Culexarchaeum yellowstonense]